MTLLAPARSAHGRCLPATFAAMFSSDPEVLAIATRALDLHRPAFGAFGLGMALYFASMGAGRMAWPVAAAVSRSPSPSAAAGCWPTWPASASTASSWPWPRHHRLRRRHRN
jgi:hypothetical protein